MKYYDVLVATKQKHFSLFTYSSDDDLVLGQIVEIPFRRQTNLGIIIKPVNKRPNSKKIVSKFAFVLPEELVESSLKLMHNAVMSYSGLANLLLGPFDPKSKANSSIKAAKIKLKLLPKLNTDQSRALKQLQSSSTPSLLKGVTGSGKTRIYMELVKNNLAQAKSSIILSPEVGLSTQLADDFIAHFGDKVIVVHSGLSKKARSNAWRNIINAKSPLIVIGPRSALFSPIKNLGLIVLDEGHDDSYKQTNEPRYQALHFASLLSQAHGAQLIYGSATPNVSDYYYFKRAGYQIVDLPSKALNAKPAKIKLIDMSQNKQDQGGLLAKETRSEVQQYLNHGQQVLVFFNRRGTARLAQCQACGWVDICQNCDYNLVLHKDKKLMICHLCGFSSIPKSVCPDCKQAISYQNPGIKKLVEEFESAFIDTQILRFDSDNLKADSLAIKLKQFKSSKRTIIVGTQMITKGLDLPLLGLVVIIRADSSLSVPDYRAEEKMFQQINQLIGRVGRGHQEHTAVIIQTYKPDHPTLIDASKGDWNNFYQRELNHRRLAGLPPFNYSLTLRVRRKTKPGVEKSAQKITEELKHQYRGLDIRGPSPAMQEMIAGSFEWLIHIFSPKRSLLIKIAKDYENKEIVDLDPNQLF